MQYANAKKILRGDVIQKFARWLYDAGLPFQVVQYIETLKDAIEAIGAYGPGMKLSSYHEMGVTCLKEEVKTTKDTMKSHNDEIAKTGYKVMMDGWTDKRDRSLINFLVNTPKGSKFMESVDASKYSHTTYKMYELLNKFVMKIDPEHVVQVIIDSASNIKKADKN